MPKAAAPHIALFRGINVGRAKRIAMAELRVVVANLGYQDVRTLLNSGNLVFAVPSGSRGDPAPRIEKAVLARLGVSSRVLVLSAAELATVVAENPLLNVGEDHSRLLVSLWYDPRDRDRLKPLTTQNWAPEAIAVGTRACYLWCPGGVLESPVGKAVGRVLGSATTVRNWATISKLRALVG